MKLGYLRFLLCLIVLTFHSGLNTYGPLAVVIFFVISGYVNNHSLETKYQNNIRKFAIARLNRLAPDFLACTILLTLFYILLSSKNPSNLVITDPKVKNLIHLGLPDILQIFIPQLYFNIKVPIFSYQMLLMPLYWSVLNELTYYLLLGAIHKFIFRKRKQVILAIGILGLILNIYFAYLAQSDLGKWNSYIYFNCIAGLNFFLIGAYLNYTSKIRVAKLNYLSPIIILSYLFISSALLPRPENSFPLPRAFNLLLVSYFLTFLTCKYLAKFNNSPVKYLPSKLEKALAYYSYSIYVWQVLGFALYEYAINYRFCNSLAIKNAFIRFLLVLIFSLGSALTFKKIFFGFKMERGT